VSAGAAVDLLDVVNVPASKVRVIYNVVVTDDLYLRANEAIDHPWFEEGQPPVILGVGRLSAAKDFGTLIRAFALVRRVRPARLMILGEGRELRQLEALTAALGIGEHVTLPGFVDNPYKFMKRASVFVLSSRWEGLSGVLIEAMALGTPVISTNCPSGPDEILEGGRWGTLVEPGDPGQMAEAIVRTIGSSVRNCAQNHPGASRFTKEALVKAYMAVLLPEYSARRSGEAGIGIQRCE
jgi:glycosyltransferase involved in cell wall biosynthesis